MLGRSAWCRHKKRDLARKPVAVGRQGLMRRDVSNTALILSLLEDTFVLNFVSQARKNDDFTLAFAGAERSAANFALDFSAVGHGENLFEAV